jgi:type II restriction endonuclease EcoO109I-like protein
MNPLELDKVREFVNENIGTFHRSRLASIQTLQLREVLKRKNPYLFKAKNVQSASELVASILEASLSSSEEGLFGHFLEELAIFVSTMTSDGLKSSAPGLDLEFSRDGIRYVVAIKSGPNWGNKSQHDALKVNFRNALRVLRQSPHIKDVRAVLGTCYGRNRTVDNGEYTKICGQNFWHFISGNPDLYVEIIEPIGYEAKRHNDTYLLEKAKTHNRFVGQFVSDFCDETGQINWAQLIQFNSGNLRNGGNAG